MPVLEAKLTNGIVSYRLYMKLVSSSGGEEMRHFQLELRERRWLGEIHYSLAHCRILLIDQPESRGMFPS